MHTHDHDLADADVTRPATTRADDRSAALAQRALAEARPGTLDRPSVLHLQRAAGNAGVGAMLEADDTEGAGAGRSPVLDVVGKGGGQPLAAETRVQMESSIGADFGDVRVHTDRTAASSASAVGAKAYTVGNEIVFGDGAFDAGSPDGQRTLAHELTHVVQQRSGPVDGTPTGDGISVSDPGDPYEQAAEASAERVVAGDAAGPVAGGAPTGVQREGEEDELQMMSLQRGISIENGPAEEAMPEEEEPVQSMALQREGEEEEELQMIPLQREGEEDEEALQMVPLQREEVPEEEMPS